MTSLKEGDPVGIAWLHDACGACEHCMTGWETLCEKQNDSGYSVNGTFAEYAIGSAAYVARLPERPDFAALAPILCAGVTTYKGMKETEARPGEWVAISGIGGLGHVAIQYAKAMGLHVVALDVTEDKLALARSLGADVAVNAKSPDAVEQVVKATSGGAHGVLVTAVSPPAFAQALHLVRRRGTVSLSACRPGDFPTPIFDVVLKRITIRGSIVGTRKDLAEALAFAAEGKVRAHIHQARLEDINSDLRRPEGRPGRRPDGYDDVVAAVHDGSAPLHASRRGPGARRSGRLQRLLALTEWRDAAQCGYELRKSPSTGETRGSPHGTGRVRIVRLDRPRRRTTASAL